MSKTTITKSLPILALRGIVLFPEMVLHFDVARKKSKAAVRAAMKDSREIFLITQRRIKTEDPQIKDLFSMGVIAEIKQIIKIPDSDTIRLVIEGKSRGEIAELTDENPYLKGIIRERRSGPPRDADYEKALIRHIRDVFDKYAQVTHMSPDVILSVMESDKACTLSDYIASVLTVDYTQKQMILSELGAIKRLEKISRLLIRETGLLEIEDKIAQKVGNQIDKNQREYYLREKMKAISSELGDVEDELNEMQLFYERIKNARMAGSSKEKLLKECMRLAKIGMSFSSEAAVIRGYLEICLDLPWGIFTNDNLNLKKAQKILDQEHYGLEKVKKRIIEFLAVRRLSPHIKGQIICLVGPPGVGKTSIAKSLAAAMGRNFARISLGGVRDIAEIRGHRKTYVGAMPGRIISAISSVKSSNPLILLDEIDKLSADYKGDPSSALLEVLDGEQNYAFADHFIEIPFDLSSVLFVTTANDTSAIPKALLDRMEVIELYSYTHEEKFNIAKKHLIPKQIKQHGLKANNLRISDDALRQIIDGYTREAGVRKLERKIAAISRVAAVGVAQEDFQRMTVTPANLETILGPAKFKPEDDYKDEVGAVNGLAWTSVGGEMLKIEVAIVPGKGKVELTGSLGGVMKESAKAAVTYIRSRAGELLIDEEFYKTKDIHIHVPQGAVPKDGPSAGAAIATALASALTGTPVHGKVAMTGEISLRGKVLPIGGLKEKTMAAYRAGMTKVLVPKDNEADLFEVDDIVKSSVEFVIAEKLEDVFDTAFIKTKMNSVVLKEVTQKKSVGLNYEI